MFSSNPRLNMIAGHLRTACAKGLLLLLLGLPAVTQAQDFNYTTNNGTITITKYIGSGGAAGLSELGAEVLECELEKFLLDAKRLFGSDWLG